jgi:hypothetical protein
MHGINNTQGSILLPTIGQRKVCTFFREPGIPIQLPVLFVYSPAVALAIFGPCPLLPLPSLVPSFSHSLAALFVSFARWAPAHWPLTKEVVVSD